MPGVFEARARARAQGRARTGARARARARDPKVFRHPFHRWVQRLVVVSIGQSLRRQMVYAQLFPDSGCTVSLKPQALQYKWVGDTLTGNATADVMNICRRHRNYTLQYLPVKFKIANKMTILCRVPPFRRPHNTSRPDSTLHAVLEPRRHPTPQPAFIRHLARRWFQETHYIIV